jgi:flagellar L-ring protein FlgH
MSNSKPTMMAIALAAAWLLAGAAWADSLYDNPQQVKEDPQAAGLYGEHPVLLEIGDILKVQVRERTVADVSLGVNSKDESKLSAKYGANGNLLGRLLTPFYKLLGEGDVSYDDKHEYKGDGKTDRSTKVDALVTAMVVDKLDNGNLVIEGRKQVKVNAESQTLVVRGVVNPSDIDGKMTVESDMVADVEVEYIGEGQLTKRTKPGFLSRVVDFVF